MCKKSYLSFDKSKGCFNCPHCLDTRNIALMEHGFYCNKHKNAKWISYGVDNADNYIEIPDWCDLQEEKLPDPEKTEVLIPERKFADPVHPYINVTGKDVARVSSQIMLNPMMLKNSFKLPEEFIAENMYNLAKNLAKEMLKNNLVVFETSSPWEDPIYCGGMPLRGTVYVNKVGNQKDLMEFIKDYKKIHQM